MKQEHQIVRTNAGEEVSLFHPHRQKWSDHFGWRDDGAEIKGLSLVDEVTIDALRMNRQALVRVRRMWVKLNEHPPQFN